MERFPRYGRLKSQEPPQKSHLLKFAQITIKVYQAASRWAPHVRGRKIESIGRAVAEIFQFERRGRSRQVFNPALYVKNLVNSPLLLKIWEWRGMKL